MTNKTPTERAAEYTQIIKGTDSEISVYKAYLAGDRDRQVIADAEYKELQDKGFKLLKEVNELMVENNRLRAWISVNDRLPDTSGGYLCVINYDHGPKTTCMTFNPKKEQFVILHNRVTHWRELPSPPELLNDKKI